MPKISTQNFQDRFAGTNDKISRRLLNKHWNCINILTISQKPFHIELNCVGILKLKNSTVEANLGPTYFTPRSTRVRLCFMLILKDNDSDRQIFLQELSLPISCSKLPPTLKWVFDLGDLPEWVLVIRWCELIYCLEQICINYNESKNFLSTIC